VRGFIKQYADGMFDPEVMSILEDYGLRNAQSNQRSIAPSGIDAFFWASGEFLALPLMSIILRNLARLTIERRMTHLQTARASRVVSHRR
jgi:hypothetical protein